MIEIAAAFLILPDGRFVFQRRSDAPINPHKLGLFGGHIEKGETPMAAMRRELEEETTWKSDELHIESLDDYQMTPNDTGHDHVHFHHFKIHIPHLNFKVLEGIGAEAYKPEEALLRDDIAPTVRYLLKEWRKTHG